MTIAIDGHVHIYPGFSLAAFFDDAWANFSKLAQLYEKSTSPDYVLLLTEGEAFDVFDDLFVQAKTGNILDTGDWRFLQTEEMGSVIVEKNNSRIFVIACRQYVSAENIELLALFSKQHIIDKSLTLVDLAETVAGNNAIPLLPWGVGKWIGRRKEVVKKLFESSRDYSLFCGDNGNRPFFWPTPSLLHLAGDLQIPMLSGSDPLPLLSHCSRVASSGTLLTSGRLSTHSPASDLHKLLLIAHESKEFGSRLHPLRFFSDQLRINLQNRL